MSWDLYAACRHVDPDVFFIGPGQVATAARAVCLRCPVKAECLAATMTAEGSAPKDQRHGVFGGLTPRERHALYNRRRKIGLAFDGLRAEIPA